jgi:hypothetical protein
VKRIFIIVALALVLPIAFSGITATGASTPPSKLSAKLLTASQMPTGWSVVSLSGGGEIGCLANILAPKGIGQTASTRIEFVSSKGYPVVGEKLATYTNAGIAYRLVVTNLAACKHWSGIIKGVRVTGSVVGQMNFPRYGNASKAFMASFTILGMAVSADVLIVREGSIIMGIIEDNPLSVSASQFRGFAKIAIEDLG